MDDIRCPMCSKPNPPGLDVCQFCQARLKPLLAETSPESDYPQQPGDTIILGKSRKQEPTVPDWLRSLRQSGEDEAHHPAEEDSPERPEDDEDREDALPHAELDDQDWLANLRQRSDVEDESFIESDEQISEWSPASKTPAGEEDADWLADIRSIGDTVQFQSLPESEEPEPPSPEDDAEPEWLHRIRSRQKIEDSDHLEDETDDLVSGIDRSEPSLLEIEERPDRRSGIEDPAPDGEDKDVPEWVSQEEAKFALDEPESEEDVSAWLTEFGKAISPDSKAPFMPDWLAEEESETSHVGPEPQEEIPKWLTDIVDRDSDTIVVAEVEDEPERLSALGESDTSGEGALQHKDEEGGERSEEDIEKQEVQAPDDGLEVVAPFTSEPDSEDLFSDEIPNWLTGVVSPGVASDSPTTQDGEIDLGLVPADLPSWLEAMRPVESAAPSAPISDGTKNVVESAGPLTGMRGVLPAELEIARLKKPPSYSIKLQVSENQQAHADLLGELIKAEGVPRPVSDRPVILQQRVLRPVIFVVLVLAIIWSMIAGGQDVTLPSFSPETFAVSSLVNGLSVGVPVLLAVDYEPGLSGEMDAASSAVVDHLMLKGAYLVLISTTPTGPAQAERLLRSVNARGGHHYQDANQYANLGYVPGGPPGLLGFAEAPRQVTPFTIDGNFAWEGNPLQDVQMLADFDLVMVVTESADTARMWIEQVQPVLGNTPLVMVISAQAEPIVRPYYESTPKQVHGIVTGLAGGASYEGLMGRNGLGHKYWNSYTLVLVVATLIIFVAGVINATSSILASRKSVEAEEQQ